MTAQVAWIGVIGVLIGALGTVLTKRVDRQIDLINQLQEERDRRDDRIEELLGKVDALTKEVMGLRSQVSHFESVQGLWRVVYEQQNIALRALGGLPVELPSLLMTIAAEGGRLEN